jgi:tetratricopeptide (TPR) repeat protein
MNGQVVYGQALFDAGRYEQAEATFTTALTLDPENLIALRHLGDISRLNGNPGSALDWYKRVLDADPRNDEILAFIDEMKTAAAAAPPPREPTPLSTATVPTPAAGAPAEPPKRTTKPSAAPVTLELDVPDLTVRSAPTPIAPAEPVPPQRKSEPKKRVSLGLIDLDINMATDAAAAADAPPPAPPEAPAEVPSGEIDLGAIDFGSMPEAPAQPTGQPMSIESLDMPSVDEPPARAEGFEAAEFEPPAGESIVAAEGLEPTDSLGWDMGGTVNLDEPATPSSEETTEPRPQVFVTETMAELYLQQGFRDEALKVYKQLAAQNPDDASLRERIAALESGGRSSMSFEKLDDAVPDFAPGTDSLIPMSEPAPAIEEALSFSETTTPAVAIPEVPVEDLDFDMSTSIPSPDGTIPETATEEAASLLDLDEPPTVPAARAPTPMPTPVAVRAATPSGVSARSFFAMLAQRKALRSDGTLPKGMDAVPAPEPAVVPQGGGSVNALFSAPPSAEDEAIGQALMTAVGLVESATPIRGRPTQQAGSELSLDSVFRSESPMRTSGPVKRQSQLIKFDQFFSADQPVADTPAASDPGPAAPADDAQFQAWLTQLKNQ